MGFLRSTYQAIYPILPARLKVLASELVQQLKDTPSIHLDDRFHPPHRLAKGVVTFSVDFELAWAWQYAKGIQEDFVVIALRERQQVPMIVNKMEEYHVPATWATVGHLFLKECKQDARSLAHPELPRLHHFESEYWKFSQGDWYQNDPCSDVSHAPAWYAPDLIELIMNARAGHEIGCHGFSHAGFGRYCTAEVAAAEIDASLEAMKAFGISPKTFVFPGNDEGHFDILARKGFRSIRSFPEPWADLSLPVRRADDLWAVHDTSAIDLQGEGWNYEKRLSRLKRFVDFAASTKLAAHIWFHPSLPKEQMERLLFPMLQYSAEQRENGLIDVLTIDQLVSATEQAIARKGIT